MILDWAMKPNFFALRLETQSIKEKMCLYFSFLKIKNFHSIKGTVKKMKRQTKLGGNIFKSSDKELVCRIHQDLSTFTSYVAYLILQERSLGITHQKMFTFLIASIRALHVCHLDFHSNLLTGLFLALSSSQPVNTAARKTPLQCKMDLATQPCQGTTFQNQSQSLYKTPPNSLTLPYLPEHILSFSTLPSFHPSLIDFLATLGNCQAHSFLGSCLHCLGSVTLRYLYGHLLLLKLLLKSPSERSPLISLS